MIPKIIHYIWFSGEPIPENLQRFMATWKEHMPDWEIRLWDGDAARALNVPFVNEALDRRKWAFASDYVRFYAVYTGGGVYLDTDIEVFQSFEPFLKHRMFISRECWGLQIPPKFCLTSHVFGAEKGHPFLRECMRYYENRHFDLFIDKNIPVSQKKTCDISPVVMRDIAIHLYDYNTYAFLNKKQVLKEDINVYPNYYFDDPLFRRDEKEVFSWHHSVGAWKTDGISVKSNPKTDFRTKKEPLRWKLSRIFRTITIKLFGRVLIIKFFKVHPSERK